MGVSYNFITLSTTQWLKVSIIMVPTFQMTTSSNLEAFLRMSSTTSLYIQDLTIIDDFIALQDILMDVTDI